MIVEDVWCGPGWKVGLLCDEGRGCLQRALLTCLGGWEARLGGAGWRWDAGLRRTLFFWGDEDERGFGDGRYGCCRWVVANGKGV